MRLVAHGLEGCEFENTCNNDKSLSKIQFEHEKEDELVVVVVKVEIENGLLEEMKVSLFRKKVIIFTDILDFLKKFGWWFEQDIGGESEDDREKRLVMVSEEGWMS
ncbi:hypothetical protein Tco_0506164 [Tanacetum coccineum]